MNSGEVEYFSFLPDALILIIITFLPFKEAVRTSVLSKRWQNLWQWSRNVDLHENFFVDGRSSDEDRSMQKRNFVGFIRRWMENYTESNLEKFRLMMPNPPENYLPQLQECISFAVDHRAITRFELDFSDRSWDEDNLDSNPHTPLLLPPLNLDAHTTLESIGLSAVDFQLPQSDTFSALKNVFLGLMEIPGSSLNNFLSNCPLLETLSLKRCWNVGNLDIKAQRLRVLVLDKCVGHEYIYVNAPLLVFFQYRGVSIYLQMEDHRSMEKAVFDFSPQAEWAEDDAQMLYNLLSQIWCVRALTVCSYMLQVLPLAEDMIRPRLENVRHLYLKTQLHFQEYYGITIFLNSCPMLEVLSIELGPRRIFEDYRPPYQIDEHPFLSDFWYPPCLVNTLKRLNVIGFKGMRNELMVLKYLLKYGKVLEYLVIDLWKDEGDDGFDMDPIYRENIERLLLFGVGSPYLQIYVTNG